MIWPFLKRHRSLVLASGALLVVLAIAATIVTVNGERLSPFPSDSSSAYDREIGEGVTVSGEQVPSNLIAVRSDSALPDELQSSDPANPWFDQMTPLIDIGPSGPLIGPTAITFTLSRPVTQDDQLTVLTQSGAEPWRSLPVEVVDSTHVRVSVNHLSIFSVFSTSKEKLKAAFQSAVEAVGGGAFEEAEPPTCMNKEKFTAEGYSIDFRAKATDTIYWCIGYEETSRDRIIKVVNNRRYPLEVDAIGLPAIDTGPVPASLVEVRRLNHLVILPRETMTFAVNPLNEDEQATLDTRVSNWSLGYEVVETVGLGLAKLIKGAIRNPERVDKLLLLAMQSRDCYNSFDVQELNTYDVIINCFDEATLVAVFGAGALLIAPFVVVFATADLGRAIGNAIGDRQNDRDRYNLTVTRKSLSDFAGGWGRHYGTLDIEAGATAVEVEAANCNIDFGSDVRHYCEDIITYSLAAGTRPDQLVGTVTDRSYRYDSVAVPESGDRDGGYDIPIGSQVTFQRERDGSVMIIIFQGDLAELFNGPEGRGLVFCRNFSDPDCGA